MAVLFAVGIGGFLGAIGRHLLSQGLHHLTGNALWGTLSANLLGCLLIGVLMVLAENTRLSPLAHKLLITGLLGSLTTFSTFSHETHRLLAQGAWWRCAGYALLSLCVGLAMVGLGRWAMAAWLGD